MNTRRRGRPKLQETAEIDRALHDAAIAVLLEHGDAATMNHVAERAGLSRKSVYARYSTKSALFVEAIRDLMGQAQNLQFDAAGAAEQQLYNYVHAALTLMTTPKARAIQGILAADPGYIGVLRAEMVIAVQRQFFEPLRKLLDSLHADGLIVAADGAITARAINALVFAYGSNLHDPAKAAEIRTLDDYAAAVTALITRGLLPRQA